MALKIFDDERIYTTPGTDTKTSAEVIAKIVSRGRWPMHILEAAGKPPDVSEWQGMSGFDVAQKVGNAVLATLAPEAIDRRNEISRLLTICNDMRPEQIAPHADRSAPAL